MQSVGIGPIAFMRFIMRTSGHNYSEWAWWARMSEFNRKLQHECAVIHGFEYEKVSGFRYNPDGERLAVWQYLPDSCHPHDLEQGFHKYRHELRNVIQWAKPSLAKVMQDEGRLFHKCQY